MAMLDAHQTENTPTPGDNTPGQTTGFESFFGQAQARSSADLTFACTPVSKLGQDDIARLEELRSLALRQFVQDTGCSLAPSSLKEELEFLPPHKTLDEKLLVSACYSGELVAYCHVLCGWPQASEWAIEQLLLRPQHRLHGIGSKLIAFVEELARTAEVRATSILSLPSRPNSASFWDFVGYQDKTAEDAEKIKAVYACMNIMKKEL